MTRAVGLKRNTAEVLRSRIAALRSQGARLDDEESAALAQALDGVPGEAWLFGSRVEAERRGGDIDVLILTGSPAFETARQVSTRFFSRCEEKIDVVVLDPEHLDPEQAEFLRGLKRVRLC